MPALPLKPCTAYGCRELTSHGRCPAHPDPQLKRGKTAERGYDADHRRLRILCFQRDGWRCVDCGWEPELVRLFREAGLEAPPAAHVIDELRQAFNRGDRHLHADHQVPIEDRPDLRLVLDNLRTRCDQCHNRKTARGQ